MLTTATHRLRGCGEMRPTVSASAGTEAGCISEALVYRREDRRLGIASALYAAIKTDLGRPLQPTRIRSKAGGRSGPGGEGNSPVQKPV